ncbi:MAG: SipW-dependent-type signal peptide-containing protein [Clostridia bacterium]|nr:SipW-dependent-type signal peptide-containing protein [Clostridia bacterium]
MNTKVKSIILALCALTVATATLFATLAYLTDKETVVNTFTVGNVDISLQETDVDGDGDESSNSYHIIPGNTYEKDPTVTVKSSSEEAYVRMILTIHNNSAVKAIMSDDKNGLGGYTDLFGGWDESVWLYYGTEENDEENTVSLEFRYFQTVDGYDADGNALDEVLPALFDTLIIPGTLNGEELISLYENDFKIVVYGHAIQSAMFESDEDGAWAAFDAQIG